MFDERGSLRIEKIIIEGIKNVEYGKVELKNFKKIMDGDFGCTSSVLGIYGQNGSGKTTILTVTKILSELLKGKKLSNEYYEIINNKLQEANVSFTFLYQSRIKEITAVVTYSFTLSKLLDSTFDVTKEKIEWKEYSYINKEWKRPITLIEVENNQITLKKLSDKFSTKDLVELSVTKDILKPTSFMFNNRAYKLIQDKIKSKDEDLLLLILTELKFFASIDLIIIENNSMGTRGQDSIIPVNLYMLDEYKYDLNRFSINLQKQNELPIPMFEGLQKVISQIDIVLHSFVPSLNISLHNVMDITLEDGKPGKSFEVVSVRDNLKIPLKYESEGIKRIISIISSLSAMYNEERVCLMIDEFDSGVFEYLLGEIVKVVFESGKGQLFFTSHNLRPVEALPYKNILFTTTDPKNRYTYLQDVKPTNNVRNKYFSALMLGGTDQNLYEETRPYLIKKAFRKAGKIIDENKT